MNWVVWTGAKQGQDASRRLTWFNNLTDDWEKWSKNKRERYNSELAIVDDGLDGLQVEEIIAGIKAGTAIVQDLVAVYWPDAILDIHQVDIIDSMIVGMTTNLNELCIKGCTGAGKGAAVAIGANLWFEISPESKIIVTSVRHAHAVDILFGEIIRWRKKMTGTPAGRMHRTQIFDTESHFMVVANPETGEGFSGYHGPAVLMLFDEASMVNEEFWDLAMTQATLRVALSNPRTLGGWFRRLFPSIEPDECQTIDLPGESRRRLVTVDAKDCLNVRTNTHAIPGQITSEQYATIMAHPSAWYRRVFGDGQFPLEDPESQLILPSWLDRHIKAFDHADIVVEAFGFDIAASEHGDATVLAAGGSRGCLDLHIRRRVDVMATTGWAIELIQSRYDIDILQGQYPICVDADGIGLGVADRLEEQGAWVIRHVGSESAEDRQRHFNRRAETWGLLSDRLNPEEQFGHLAWAIPNDSELIEELIAQEKETQSDGQKFKLIPKKEIKKKLGRSPDRGDAVAYLYMAVRQLHSGGDDSQIRDGEMLIISPDEVDDYESDEHDDDFNQDLADIIQAVDDIGR